MKRAPFHTEHDVDSLLNRIGECLDAGGVLLAPTETFYGLACNPRSAEGVRKIYRLKERPEARSLPVLAADWSQVEALVRVPPRWESILRSIWPGPVTAVLPSVEPLAAAPGSTLAVRIPSHRLLRRLLAGTGPLTGTSANRHGAPPPDSVDAALTSLAALPDLVLDGGATPGGAPSDLVDLTGDRAEILRVGAGCWHG